MIRRRAGLLRSARPAPQGHVLLQPRFVLATAGVYGLLGAVGYIQTVLLPCRGTFSFVPVLPMLMFGPFAYLISTGIIATRSGERWVGRTVVNVAAALLLGTALAHSIYAALARFGPECGAVHLCAGCVGSSFFAGIVQALVPALAGAVLAPVVGWIARRLR